MNNLYKNIDFIYGNVVYWGKKEGIVLNLSYLRYFVTLAHVRHYTRAAEQLCITQPSLSHAIVQMEKELGIPLFEKNGRNTTLTRYGEEFLTCAEHTLSTLDTGMEFLRRSARGAGLIRLGILRMLGIEYIPRLAAEFLQENPHRDIQFAFHTGDTQHLLDELEAGKHDLAFCSRPAPRRGLTAVPVQKQKLVLITPKNHSLACRDRIDLSETVSYPQIFFAKSSGIRGVVEQMYEQIGAKPEISYETEEDEVIAGLVAHGFGIAIVPYMDFLLKLNVKILPISYPDCQRELFLVHDDRVFLPPVANDFREFVLSRCRENSKEA